MLITQDSQCIFYGGLMTVSQYSWCMYYERVVLVILALMLQVGMGVLASTHSEFTL